MRKDYLLVNAIVKIFTIIRLLRFVKFLVSDLVVDLGSVVVYRVVTSGVALNCVRALIFVVSILSRFTATITQQLC